MLNPTKSAEYFLQSILQILKIETTSVSFLFSTSLTWRYRCSFRKKSSKISTVEWVGSEETALYSLSSWFPYKVLRLQFVERTLYPLQKPKGCKRSDRSLNVVKECLWNCLECPGWYQALERSLQQGPGICPLHTARPHIDCSPMWLLQKMPHPDDGDVGLSPLAPGEEWNGALPDSGHAMEVNVQHWLNRDEAA